MGGILSPDGGLRVVISTQEDFYHHVSPGDRVFIVPDLIPKNPSPLDEVPDIIARVQKYVEEHK